MGGSVFYQLIWLIVIFIIIISELIAPFKILTQNISQFYQLFANSINWWRTLLFKVFM